MNKNDLTDDQNDAIDRLYNFDETFLVAPTGAGKTAIVLTAISELMDVEEGPPAPTFLHRVLVIAPLKVCLTTWANEAQKWSHLSNIRVRIAVGSPEQRCEALYSDADVVVVNEENVEWVLDGDFYTDFDGLVIDETSRWSQIGGSRYKALRKVVKGFKWRVGMTAEPVSEDWVRLYGQLRLIDLGKSLGKSKDRYLRKHFYPTDWEQRNWEVLPEHAEKIAKKIRPIVHVMPDYKADTLPEKRVTYVPITLPAEAFRRYTRMRIDSILEVEGETIQAGSRAVLSGRLEQIAAGFSYIDDKDGTGSGSRNWIQHHFKKINWAAGRADEIMRAGESVIIVYWYQAEKEILRDMFPDALEISGTPKQISADMKKWKERTGQIMLLQPSNASHGVDGLQETCYRQIWLGPIWSKDKTNQCGDRLWRRGQRFPVDIEIAVAVGTVDEVKRNSVEIKGDHHELFLEHLGEGSDGLTLAERTAIEKEM